MLLHTPPSSSDLPIDTAQVRHFFSSRPHAADPDFLSREVAGRMGDRLSLLREKETASVLSVGCGFADVSFLQARFPRARIIGVDGMGSGTMVSAPDRLCADLANLPFADASVEVLWSNMALHWHSSPARVLAEWRRVLREDGALFFSCLGGETLIQLREAFAQVDAYPHILPFLNLHTLGDMLVSAGFPSPVLDRETLTLTYTSVDHLFAEVRVLGCLAHKDRRRGLMGRAAWQRVQRCLQDLGNARGTIPLRVDILHGHAFCSREAQGPHRR
ncbi:MAG: methyltransferase domain-containing protein [Burkholderiaceae bacterium]|jgi:malonyl-CoA O-methyltransferase|nr:methyltransferase domain-containing protein [Burkholderiaceae bacterium]